MKLLSSLVLAAIVGLLVNATGYAYSFFTAKEMKEVDQRLNAIGSL